MVPGEFALGVVDHLLRRGHRLLGLRECVAGGGHLALLRLQPGLHLGGPLLQRGEEGLRAGKQIGIVAA